MGDHRIARDRGKREHLQSPSGYRVELEGPNE
jgi:hypothetical protein